MDTDDQQQEDRFLLPPQEVPLTWRNRRVMASYHILSGDEEVALVRRRNAEESDPDSRLQLEGFLRLAHALLRFGEHTLIHADEPDPESAFEARLAYIRTWPTNLLDVLLAHYTVAATAPLVDPDALDSYLSEEA